jgi:predicted MPP superfamily phosphohydrolase
MPRESVFRFAVFFTIFLTVWASVNAYVFWRTSSVPVVARNVPRWAFVMAAVFLAASYILARFLDRAGWSALAAPLEFVGATWMGVVFLAFCAFLSVDIVTGFGTFFRSQTLGFRGWALVAAGVLSLIALVQGLRAPVVREHEVRLNGLPKELDGTTLVLLSDMHLGTLIGKEWLAARVEQVKELKPDLVILCGDILEGDSRREDELASLLGGFAAPLGTFAVTGNHEYYAGVEKSVVTLKGAGLTVLRDRSVEVRPGLVLAGVDDLTARRQYGLDGAALGKALSGRPPGATIFLSHTPWKAGEAAREGAGLMLSGHTHAGQIWPFGYLARINYPVFEGRYDVGGMPVLVCRGTGTWGPRMRLWRPGEILRITLRA